MIGSLKSLVANAITKSAEAAAAPAGDVADYQALADSPHSTSGTFWMPEPASVTADGVDWIYYGLIGLSIFCFVGITFATVYFVMKYRAKSMDQKALPSHDHHDVLEITWTVIPSIIVVFLFLFGWREYIKMRTPPQSSIEVQAYGTQWNWLFTQPNGVKDNVLHVPVDKPVRLVMTSQKVLHSLYIPAFRIKQDVVPRRYTKEWFRATKPGVYRIYCAEFCGRDHSLMKTKVVVHEPGGYERYLEAKKAEANTLPPAELGEQLYTSRGCLACHSTDGSPRVGPSFQGLFGSKSDTDKGTFDVDESYLKESILQAGAKYRNGFPKSMPVFEGQLTDAEVTGLIEYIKTLK